MVTEEITNSVIVRYGIILLFVCHGFQASLDCSFDHGYCGWQQDTLDIFDWQREIFSTSTTGTGPSGDHTSGLGYYIYIEASRRNIGDMARLNSPVQTSGQYCLSFWLSMYGSNIGSLNVYMKSIGKNEILIFSRYGNVGDNRWRNVGLSINVPENYTIVLEGIRGNGYQGDIAIDDISITTGTCADCNFDNGICHWTQSNSDDFDWTLQKGGTPTLGTGPTADHTSTNGQYIFTKSAYRKGGDKAWIMSPLLPSGKYCFSFWFYMYGEDVYRLTVVGVWNANGTSSELFNREGNQGQKWIHGNIFINTKSYLMIVFEGRVNNSAWYLSSKGDIAIDDVLLLSCHDCYNPTPKHATVTTDSTNFTYGSEIEIRCDKGYSLKGESKMICLAGGSWSVSPPICELYDCGNRRMSNGKFFTLNGTTFGKTASQVCNIGYKIVGDTVVACTASGWNGTVATCTIVDCGNRKIPNGKFNALNGTTFGQRASQVCNTGYTIVGDTDVVCTASGWNGTVATCTIVDCGNRTISHGKFIATEGTTFGQTATHVCDIGHTLTGVKTVTCEASGWNDTAASCTVVDSAENSALLAVYVSVPVAIALAILFTIFILRRRHPKCQKKAEANEESRKNPTLELYNRTPKRENYTDKHGNDVSYDCAAKTDVRSETIDTSENVYNIICDEQIFEKNDGHDYGHIHKVGNVQFVNESYSHLPGGSKTVKCQLEHEDPDYHHALAGGLDTVAPEYDDYSHLNDAIKNKICSPSNSDHEYASVNKILKSKERTAEKSTAGYEEPWR